MEKKQSNSPAVINLLWIHCYINVWIWMHFLLVFTISRVAGGSYLHFYYVTVLHRFYLELKEENACVKCGVPPPFISLLFGFILYKEVSSSNSAICRYVNDN